MKRTKKILAMLLCAVLLVTGTVAVTVAYLTASTTVVNNTFTVGKVEIALDEADVDEYGVEIADADRVYANEYKLIPGHTYVKDPTVYVKKGSEVCWVFVKVNVTEDVAGVLDNFTVDTSKWISLEVDNKVVPGVYYYVTEVDARNITTDYFTLDPVFSQFKILDNADLTQVTTDDAIKIDAYAVQADGFATAAAAWKAAPTDWGN